MVEEIENNKVLFGLMGKNISYSFSRGYFKNKFVILKLKTHQYVNFDIQSIDEFQEIINNNRGDLKGLNVTIPYKEDVLDYLDEIDSVAKKIGAVNTICFTKERRLKGYNTDVFGFKESILPLIKAHHTKALILGTGGASKAVEYALKELHIDVLKVSRNSNNSDTISYKDLSEKVINERTIIVNSTPIGTHPNVDEKPNIPYKFINNKHLLFDLTYTPSVTAFLSEGKNRGATIKNGYQMLELQADEAWRIWNT